MRLTNDMGDASCMLLLVIPMILIYEDNLAKKYNICDGIIII